jgi:pilus assembly protein CpaF
MSFELILPFFRPIERLLLDDTVSEIMGNPDGVWWFETRGQLACAEGVRFDPKALIAGLEVIANYLGKKLGEDTPLLNAQLPDGSRLAAVLPPVVRPGPAVTIRKFRQKRYTIEELIDAGSLTEEMANFLEAQVRDGKTLLISGGTGSGKTTLLNALVDFIAQNERIVVIEDTAELRINHPNILAAECQIEMLKTKVNYDTLLQASLRWRPDRIILGEVRGEEARTLLDSFNTGHGGSMATIHANSPVKALRRFGDLAMRSHQQATREDLATEIADSVDYVIQIKRCPDGRKVSDILRSRASAVTARCSNATRSFRWHRQTLYSRQRLEEMNDAPTRGSAHQEGNCRRSARRICRGYNRQVRRLHSC